MNKTLTYVLIVIGAYLLIIFPKINSKKESGEKTEKKTENKADTKNGTGLNENADENGVSRGAAGQMKYRIGYVK